MKGVSNAMEYTRNNSDKLILHLFAILNTELEKPYKEIDTDFVNVCVELILELQGKNFTLSNEEIEDKVRKIPFVDATEIKLAAQEKKKKLKTKKILLVAAIITILCALLAVISSGRFVEHWHTVINEKFGSVFNMPTDEFISNGNEEIGLSGKTSSYDNIKDFYKNENPDVLIPENLPENIELKEINVNKQINSIIVTFDSVVSMYEITLNTALPQVVSENITETVTINNILCYINRMEDIHSVQIYFEHNGNYYFIGGDNEQILFNIIENLEK